MIANYHTHTFRCRHAQGTEREYIEAAIARGMKTLGFSDHAPYCFEGDYYSGFRMLREEFPDYVETLRALKKEYAGQIEICIGLEMEYYPRFFKQTLDFIRPLGVDYLILGQHMLDNEMDGGEPSSAPGMDGRKLEKYVNQVLEGLSTGAFSYLAHPDMLNFKGLKHTWQKHMERLCARAKDMNIPLEMNLLGFLENRHYPRKDFFEIAKEMGNDVIIGCDAHTVAHMKNEKLYEEAKKWLQGMGIEPVDTLNLRNPFLYD